MAVEKDSATGRQEEETGVAGKATLDQKIAGRHEFERHYAEWLRLRSEDVNPDLDLSDAENEAKERRKLWLARQMAIAPVDIAWVGVAKIKVLERCLCDRLLLDSDMTEMILLAGIRADAMSALSREA